MSRSFFVSYVLGRVLELRFTIQHSFYIFTLVVSENMKLAVFTLVAISATVVDASLHPIIAARRLNLKRQDPANVCTVIPAQTITVTGANPVELPAVCLCSNTVDAYADDLGLSEAATAEISRDLQTDIDDSDTPCTAPANGMPTCNDDECDFACDAGFVRDGDIWGGLDYEPDGGIDCEPEAMSTLPSPLEPDDFQIDSMGTTEDMIRYSPGGYHPVTLGNILHGNAGAYRVMHKLGFGSYATVWLAQRTGPSAEFVALKITTSENQGSTEADMLTEVARIPHRLERSHVLTLLDSFEHRGPNGVHSVLVTDVVVPLLALNPSKRPPAWRRSAAHGLARAVAQLHAAGVVHGDLHLGNTGIAIPQLSGQDPGDVMQDLPAYDLTVVLPVNAAHQTPSLPPYVVAPCDLAAYYDKVAGDAKPETKLFDFGNAHKAATLPSRFQCALEACAPEVVFALVVEQIDNPPVELPADIWALGATVYEIFTGSSLFHGVGMSGLPKSMASMSATLPPAWKALWDSASRPCASPDAWWTERRERLRGACANDRDADALLDLLKRILVLNPAERPSAAEIAQDPWFTTSGKGLSLCRPSPMLRTSHVVPHLS
ncbi:kinase-like protein [Schizophyllum commune H4-8]|uniref:kinase-like protein n=1 Tax=Schizophyllum commune (strain H4-8 / FGSC 9210) TaxID=578458 RepID=UPI00215F2085|nr:kinase-like protein [Schizophyllum commune H4-8]KAI5886663.1 kinase-like protein [Schizophyllum commune H4-8]